MKRLQWIILKNFWRIPGLMIRLNRRIRSPENYTDEERLEPIQYFCRKVQENGNISVELLLIIFTTIFHGQAQTKRRSKRFPKLLKKS